MTGNDIRATFIASVYQPLTLFPRQARMLADALAGNYSLLLEYAGIPHIQDACAAKNAPGMEDGLFSISCSDAGGAEEHDLEYYQKVVEQLKGQSDTFGARWAEIPIQCMALQSRAKWRFRGPWTTPPADPSLKDGIPAAPLLLLTARLDPVTPLVSANRMSAGHPGLRW